MQKHETTLVAQQLVPQALSIVRDIAINRIMTTDPATVRVSDPVFAAGQLFVSSDFHYWRIRKAVTVAQWTTLLGMTAFIRR